MSGFRFIDLFAGIGGIRQGFEGIGGVCVFSSEINKWARETYVANYGDHEPLIGDIVGYPESEIPDHDILLAGFPCQPFSLAGVSKRNALGQPHGFACATQGTLFFDVARILKEKRPRGFLLENVKNLLSHDRGRTFEVISRTLTEDLGYHIWYKVVDGRHWVPQHRERILIVGFQDDVGFNWEDVILPSQDPVLSSILHPEDGTEPPEEPYTGGSKGQVSAKYVLTANLWDYLQRYAAKHRARGNGFGYGLVGPSDVARTLSARYYKDGAEILVSRGEGQIPRRLTPRECARLMGFGEGFVIPVSDTQAYRQFGNSVVVPMIRSVAHAMAPHIPGASVEGAAEWTKDISQNTSPASQLKLFAT